MNSNLEQYLQLLWKSVIFWSFALGCYIVFRFLGLEDEKGLIIAPEYKGLISFSYVMGISATVGVVLGFLYASIEFFFEKIITKKISLGLSLLFENSIAFIITIAILTITFSTISNIFNIEINTARGWWTQDKTVWPLLIYILLSSFVFSFIKIALERFGSGMFLKMLIGKYKTPKEEQRIFMFIDLKDSTAIAEKLQHYVYSKFIQDCFYDLNSILLPYKAEIYQYVGDEVVLTWPFKKGIRNSNCIDVFFAFQKKLQSREKYYLDTYGFFPQFKAGVHGGKIMVTEVGTVKKDLAYHGDVINTSSRIQKACNAYNVSFLISETLLNALTFKAQFPSTFLGEVLLKGKQEEVKIHSLTSA
ncbi:adenylate/guanylate cyclase domain-containing protein [Tenacibaculum amylolyticum]|uniref:adenylate/guanylate cyclase domain-containing protein n=1 Tax=Tenacibaculum amylolyticum TaxID=104269 RepID=UPI003892CC61